VIYLVGLESELFDVLVSRVLVNDTLISINNMSFCLMAKHSLDWDNVELASCFCNYLCNLSVSVTRFQ